MLELYLENIKCHDQSRFIFPDLGLVLLKGASGSGKSSILDSILFVLFGTTGKNLISYGHKKCKVIFCYDDWKITRCKGPNRLELIDEKGDKYEDNIAQYRITEKYGHSFKITSYVTQLNKDSFLYLSPADRMLFLEKLSYGDIDIEQLKIDCKSKIKDRKERLLQATGYYQAITKECDGLVEPKKVEWPLKGSYNKNRIEKYRIKISDNNKLLITVGEDIDKLNNRITAQKFAIQQRDKLKYEYETLSREKQELEKDLPLVDIGQIKDIEDRIRYLQINKEIIALREAYNREQENFQTVTKLEMDKLCQTLEELQMDNCEIIDKREELKLLMGNAKLFMDINNIIKNTREELDELDTLENYNDAIEDARNKEQELIQKQIRSVLHKCPNCSAVLQITSNGVIAYGGAHQEEINCDQVEKELKITRKDLSDYLSSKQEVIILTDRLNINIKKLSMLNPPDVNRNYEKELKENMEQLSRYQDRIKQIGIIKHKINNKDLSLTVSMIGQKIDKMLAEIRTKEKLMVGCVCKLEENNIDKLRDMMYDLKLSEQKHRLMFGRISEINIKLERIKTEIDNIFINTVEDLDGLLNERVVKLEEIKIKKSKYELVDAQLTLYISYRRELDEYNKWQDKLEIARNEEKRLKDSLIVAEKLFRKIQETESASIIGIIDTINAHAQYYLEKFFIDPIEMTIKSFKETAKDTKPCVNIHIGYKGQECELSNLSGGERARVEVAICLAINSLVNSKIILLDESLGPLDIDTIESILEILKHEEKLIITVLHQAIDGMFDNVIIL